MGHPIGTDYTVLTLQLGCEADPQKISSPKEQGGRRPCRSRFQSVLSPSNYTVLSVKLCYVGVGHGKAPALSGFKNNWSSRTAEMAEMAE